MKNSAKMIDFFLTLPLCVHHKVVLTTGKVPMFDSTQPIPQTKLIFPHTCSLVWICKARGPS